MPNNKINKECKFCGKLFRWTSSLALHLRIHTNERPYSCAECGKTFTQKVHLQRHSPVHDPGRKYKRNFADEILNRNSTEDKNMNDAMSNDSGGGDGDGGGQRSPMNSSPSDDADIAPTTTTAEDIRCQECDTTFDRWLDLLQHTSEAHPRLEDQEMNEADECDGGDGDGSVNDSIRKLRTTWCHICRKHLATVSSRNLHMRIHTGERPFACNVCSKAFTQNVHLRSHMSVHTGAKPYACKICNKAGFVAGRTLKIHMMSHTREQPHTCQWCSRKFLVRQHLVTHMATHHAEMLHGSSADEDESPPTMVTTPQVSTSPPHPPPPPPPPSSSSSVTPSMEMTKSSLSLSSPFSSSTVSSKRKSSHKSRKQSSPPKKINNASPKRLPIPSVAAANDADDELANIITSMDANDDDMKIESSLPSDYWQKANIIKVEPASEQFETSKTNVADEKSSRPIVTLKPSRRKSSAVSRAKSSNVSSMVRQAGSSSPRTNSSVDSISSATVSSNNNGNNNNVVSSQSSQPQQQIHSHYSHNMLHSQNNLNNDSGVSVVGTSMQQCPNCMVVEGELQLLKTELTMIKQFLGSKLTLMEQKIDNMSSLIRQ